jgi:hypothetical protein
MPTHYVQADYERREYYVIEHATGRRVAIYRYGVPTISSRPSAQASANAHCNTLNRGRTS